MYILCETINWKETVRSKEKKIKEKKRKKEVIKTLKIHKLFSMQYI